MDAFFADILLFWSYSSEVIFHGGSISDFENYETYFNIY
jgi:hypothetical protein